MPSQVLLPSMLFMVASSLLMQLVCTQPVAVLCHQLDMNSHRLFDASGVLVFFCSAVSMPLLFRRTLAPQPRLALGLAIFVAASGIMACAMVAGPLLFGPTTRSALLRRLRDMEEAKFRSVIARYLDTDFNACLAWSGCRAELAGHMHILLLSAAFFNGLACLLQVGFASIVLRNLVAARPTIEAEVMLEDEMAQPGPAPPLPLRSPPPPELTTEEDEE